MGSILLTGASGYVGMHLVRALVTNGEMVHLLMRDSQKVPSPSVTNNIKIHVYHGTYESLSTILENNEMTKTLEQAGLSPGNTIMLKKSKDSSYDIETETTTLSLDEDIAAKIIVQN